MNHRNNRNTRPAAQQAIEHEKRRVAQLILEKHIVAGTDHPVDKRAGEIVGKPQRIAVHGERQYLDRVTAAGQMVDKLFVVQITAGQCVDGPVDDDPDFH